MQQNHDSCICGNIGIKHTFITTIIIIVIIIAIIIVIIINYKYYGYWTKDRKRQFDCNRQ